MICAVIIYFLSFMNQENWKSIGKKYQWYNCKSLLEDINIREHLTFDCWNPIKIYSSEIKKNKNWKSIINMIKLKCNTYLHLKMLYTTSFQLISHASKCLFTCYISSDHSFRTKNPAIMESQCCRKIKLWEFVVIVVDNKMKQTTRAKRTTARAGCTLKHLQKQHCHWRLRHATDQYGLPSFLDRLDRTIRKYSPVDMLFFLARVSKMQVWFSCDWW